MNRETTNSKKTILQVSVGLVSLIMGSAIIILLLLPFGYNFTATWLYSVSSLGYVLLILGTVYICGKWWLLRHSEQAIPFGYAAALVAAAIGIGLYLIRDLFVWPELASLLGVMLLYIGAIFVIYANPKSTASTIPMMSYIVLSLSIFVLLFLHDHALFTSSLSSFLADHRSGILFFINLAPCVFLLITARKSRLEAASQL